MSEGHSHLTVSAAADDRFRGNADSSVLPKTWDNGDVEVSTKGRWRTVPAVLVEDKALIVAGGWLKRAIVHAEEWLETGVEDPEPYVRALRSQKHGSLRADIFSFSQKLPATEPRHSFPMEWQSVAALRTESYAAWWDALPQVTRKNVRRAEKRDVRVVVKKLDDDLIRDIVDVNNDSTMRQRVPFTHYGKTFEQVKKDQTPFSERSDFICAYVGERMIGFIKVVYRGDIASILQILPRASEQDRRPANALLAKTVEACSARGISYLTYGLFNYGNKRDSSLKEFKVRNGFDEILVPRYHVPLNIWGATCIRMGLHRGLLGMLPSAVIKAGVNARAVWYGVKGSSK